MAMQALQGARVLVVEDEFLIAEALKAALRDAGAVVLGPAGNIDAALAIIDGTLEIDAAVLDANLGGDLSLPVVSRLTSLDVPILLTTGYDQEALPAAMAALPRCEKPCRPVDVVVHLQHMLHR